MVAKGVSPPNLGLWLFICLFSNKGAATWPRFCFWFRSSDHPITRDNPDFLIRVDQSYQRHQR